MSINVKDITIGEGLPKVCVPIVEDNDEAILDKLKEFDQLDVDIIELRIDFYKNILQFDALKNLFLNIAALQIKKPIILTIRTAAEGGEIEIDPKDYFHVYELGIESKAFDIYDVELSSGTNAIITLNNMIHEANRKVIMSSHDFTRTPSLDTMLEKIKQMDSLEADIIKLAVMPEDYKDVLLVLEMTLRANEIYDKPIVTMSMSNLGIATRILGEQFGSAITFGKDNVASASGQIDIRSLKEALKIVHENS